MGKRGLSPFFQINCSLQHERNECLPLPHIGEILFSKMLDHKGFFPPVFNPKTKKKNGETHETVESSKSESTAKKHEKHPTVNGMARISVKVPSG